MAKKKNDPGYLLPEVINPDTCCICIPIPNDFNHKMAFLGQLDELGYWWNWEKDPLHKGKDAAAVWRKIVTCIREDLDMSGCGCGSEGEYPVQERFNEDGELEASTDGGATWELAPERDARNAVVLLPPRPEGAGDGQCLSAENAVNFFKDMLDTIFAQLGAGGGAAAAAPAAIALLITIGFPTGLGAVLALVYGLISAVIGLVTAGLEGTFDGAFYDELKCAFFCVIDADGTITAGDIDAIYAQMFTYTGGNLVAMAVIGDILTTVGEKGWTNAARGDSVPSSDCADCECPNCATKYEIFDRLPGDYGTILGYGGDWVDVQCGAGGYLTLQAIDINDCCFLGSVETISGTGVASAHLDCGTDFSGGFIPTTPIGECNSFIEAQFSVNGVMRFHFGECS